MSTLPSRQEQILPTVPEGQFRERIAKVVGNVQISLVARNTDSEAIGVCVGLTDFAYRLFWTYLGVDRRYVRHGIGRRMVEATHELAGGEQSIAMFTNVDDEAISFYESVGMKASSGIFVKWEIDLTSFEVGKDPLP